jgi:hypothetical protein
MNAYLALDFNLFSYIDPREALLSDLIAEFLSPEGKHGQGDVFLHLFGRQIGIEEWPPNKRPTVRREVPITYPPHSYGFLDILVDVGSFGIGIENKPWAGEQPEQLGRYRAHLEHQYSGRYALVYLSGPGTPPTTLPAEVQERLASVGQFRTLSYKSGLTKWLRACEKECKAEKIRWLLRDFESFLTDAFDLEGDEGRSEDEPGRN